MTRSFTAPGELRGLLCRLAAAGPDAWRHDPEAAELMTYAMEKYAALARKHHLEPDDGAYAALTVLRTLAVRTADDPWSVVTRAVQISLIAEERANGLLCSTHQARRPEVSAEHDAERFSDRETDLCDYHPAFQVLDETDVVTGGGDEERPDRRKQPTTAHEAADLVAKLFTCLGWPEHAVRRMLVYIESRLVEAGNPLTAHEYLRRDRLALAALDLCQSDWTRVLNVVLGNPAYENTNRGRGVLLRFAIGDTLADLLADDVVVMAVSDTAPHLDVADRLERILADA